MVKNLFKGCLTVPNLLSLIRIFLIPAFAVLYYKGHIGWAVLMLALSGISDFLDGKIARRFNQVSELGKIQVVNGDACIGCGQCELRCPDYAIFVDKVKEEAAQ